MSSYFVQDASGAVGPFITMGGRGMTCFYVDPGDPQAFMVGGGTSITYAILPSVQPN